MKNLDQPIDEQHQSKIDRENIALGIFVRDNGTIGFLGKKLKLKISFPQAVKNSDKVAQNLASYLQSRTYPTDNREFDMFVQDFISQCQNTKEFEIIRTHQKNIDELMSKYFATCRSIDQLTLDRNNSGTDDKKINEKVEGFLKNIARRMMNTIFKKYSLSTFSLSDYYSEDRSLLYNNLEEIITITRQDDNIDSQSPNSIKYQNLKEELIQNIVELKNYLQQISPVQMMQKMFQEVENELTKPSLEIRNDNINSKRSISSLYIDDAKKNNVESPSNMKGMNNVTDCTQFLHNDGKKPNTPSTPGYRKKLKTDQQNVDGSPNLSFGKR